VRESSPPEELSTPKIPRPPNNSNHPDSLESKKFLENKKEIPPDLNQRIKKILAKGKRKI